MTAVGEPSRTRCAIHVGASDVIVSDNQIYTRGPCDTNVTALRLTEPAINLLVHDNLVRNCGVGLVSDTAYALVGEVVDPQTFKAGRSGVPMERRRSHRYGGWNVAWFRGTKPDGLSILESFDPETFRFTLKEARAVKVGDRFEVFAPAANWNLHDNTIAGCAAPVVLGGHGSRCSIFRNNIIERGGANATQAIDCTAAFKLDGNQLAGFAEREGEARQAP
jgi:hypothetical protein